MIACQGTTQAPDRTDSAIARTRSGTWPSAGKDCVRTATGAGAERLGSGRCGWPEVGERAGPGRGRGPAVADGPKWVKGGWNGRGRPSRAEQHQLAGWHWFATGRHASPYSRRNAPRGRRWPLTSVNGPGAPVGRRADRAQQSYGADEAQKAQRNHNETSASLVTELNIIRMLALTNNCLATNAKHNRHAEQRY